MKKLIVLASLLFSVGLVQASSTRIIPVDSFVSADTTKSWSLPSAADTLVGRASTDTLSNKSISGSSNTITNIPLSTAVTGNLSTTHLNSGTAASSTTFWRGDGTWATPTVGAAAGLILTPVTKTGNYTVSSSDVGNILIADTSAGSFSFTLPAASGVSGYVFHITKIGNGTLTILRSGSDLILGQTSQSLTGTEVGLVIYSDGGTAYHAI